MACCTDVIVSVAVACVTSPACLWDGGAAAAHCTWNKGVGADELLRVHGDLHAVRLHDVLGRDVSAEKTAGSCRAGFPIRTCDTHSKLSGCVCAVGQPAGPTASHRLWLCRTSAQGCL